MRADLLTVGILAGAGFLVWKLFQSSSRAAPGMGPAPSAGLPANIQAAIDTGTYDAQVLRTDPGYGYNVPIGIAPRMTIQPVTGSFQGWLLR